eukprot:jgi/Mesvir1/5900/Mv00671-RA.1
MEPPVKNKQPYAQLSETTNTSQPVASQYGAPQYGAMQYPPQQYPYPTAAPPPAQAMLPPEPGVMGYPKAPLVALQPLVPPGAPPGGKWDDTKYWGGKTWTCFGVMCMFMMPCPLCLCPCDKRRVYFAPDGQKYFANGKIAGMCTP